MCVFFWGKNNPRKKLASWHILHTILSPEEKWYNWVIFFIVFYGPQILCLYHYYEVCSTTIIYLLFFFVSKPSWKKRSWTIITLFKQHKRQHSGLKKKKIKIHNYYSNLKKKFQKKIFKLCNCAESLVLSKIPFLHF